MSVEAVSAPFVRSGGWFPAMFPVELWVLPKKMVAPQLVLACSSTLPGPTCAAQKSQDKGVSLLVDLAPSGSGLAHQGDRHRALPV